MEHLALDEPATLVVHDFGGPIALDWALEHPERIGRLVVVNSWMWSFTDDRVMTRRASMVHGALGRWMYRRLNASLRLIMPSAFGNRRALSPAIHAQYLAPFADVDARERVLWALARALIDSARFYDSLWERRGRLERIPVDILWGMKDSAFGPDILSKWERGIPHARVTRLAAAGHWPHEEVPAEFLDALRRTT